ncbi:MAG: hypothetical protein HFG32_11085 [Eubacterium sp.]|nr:hypothetical protein [Eubacterium sp.]
MRLSFREAEVTRSLSNLIKYPFVDMRGKEAFIIDNNRKEDMFVPLHEGKKKLDPRKAAGADVVECKTMSEIEAEKALQAAGLTIHQADTDEKDGQFSAGLPVTDLDEVLRKRQKEAEDAADQHIAEAKKEAEKIKEEAQIAADAARASGYEAGRNQGYEDGMAEAEQDIQQKEAELAESARLQREELASCLAGIESKYVDVVIALVRKLTDVVIEDKKDLILYLIRTAARDLEPSENYKIRVSSDDVYYLEAHKAELSEYVGESAVFEFVEEKGLEKGQCIIETDSQMADCGFQTQLDMLVRDLKMLVN